MLGDNSPNSEDGRWWGEPTIASKGWTPPRAGVVPRYYLVGKALFVYWPSGFEFPWPQGLKTALLNSSRGGNVALRLLNGLATLRWVPNVGQMRFIYGGTGKTEPPPNEVENRSVANADPRFATVERRVGLALDDRDPDGGAKPHPTSRRSSQMRTCNPILVTAVAAVCFGATAASCADKESPRSKLVPEYLRCEYLVDPLGIGERKPRLSWIIQSEERGQVQTAYRILVASDPKLSSEGQGDLWDSGKVTSNRSAQVVYEGKPLASQMRCYWKVRVWDKDGRPVRVEQAGVVDHGPAPARRLAGRMDRLGRLAQARRRGAQKPDLAGAYWIWSPGRGGPQKRPDRDTLLPQGVHGPGRPRVGLGHVRGRRRQQLQDVPERPPHPKWEQLQGGNADERQGAPARRARTCWRSRRRTKARPRIPRACWRS